MKKVERLIRIGLAALLLVGYWLAYFVLRGVVAVRVNEAYVIAYVEKRGNLSESEKLLKLSN